jgi:predicted  nucleic acid-binding Zn-ribbon protein
MTTAASGLRELHQLHIEHTDVLDQLDAGPRKVRAREALTVKRQAELDLAQQGLTDLRKASDERGLQLKVNETKLVDLRSKLNAASSNKEFGIIKGQIDADVAANAVLEDEILELFERIDSAQGRVGEVEVEREAATVELQRSMDEVAAAEAGLEQQRDHLKQGITEAESVLSQDAAERYQRLVKAHGPGAMAEVVEGSCTACSIRLSQQLVVELSLGQIVSCNNCGRLLYLAEEAAE